MKRSGVGMIAAVMFMCMGVLSGGCAEIVQSEGSVKTETVSSQNQGYAFMNDGTTLCVNMEFEKEKLGEPAQYYEAKSCAFEGLDKIYTYPHFEINTYPVQEKDYISSIVLLDDLCTTKEGAYIGMGFSSLKEIYGEPMEQNGFFCYEKDGMLLKFVIEEDQIRSISYEKNDE